MYDSRLYIPKLSGINKWIIFISASIYILQSIISWTLGYKISNYFALSASNLSSGLFYTFATYPFFQEGFIQIIFELLLLWFIGTDVEKFLGRTKYIIFLASSVLFSGIVYATLSAVFSSTLFSQHLMGLTGICYLLLVAYALLFPERNLTFMLLFPMKAKYFCLALGIIQLYLGFAPGAEKTSWAHLTSMLFAILFMKFKTFKIRTKKRPNIIKKDNVISLKGPKYWQ